MLKALSLLELVVVMAIIAALMGLGISALINYRASVQLQGAYTDTVSAIKTIQNKASNSSSVTVGAARISPDIYVLRFENNILKAYYCTVSGVLLHCDEYSSVGINSFQQAYNVLVSANCAGAGFARLSGDLVSVSTASFPTTWNGISTTTGSCVLTLTQSDSGDQRQITFDLTQNKVDL